MRRVAIVVWMACVIGLSAVAAAQTARATSGSPTRLALSVETFDTGPQVTATAGPRRRGSMVGYIEDPVIGSKLRIRFETAFHDVAPDRAEFFYAKCGCYKDLNPADSAYDPKAPGPRPGAANDVDFAQLYIYGEYAPNDRVSVFGEMPSRWLRPQGFIPGTGAGFPNQQGLGDIRGGVRVALNATEMNTVTLQVRTFLPTGDAAKGLGTNHASLEPALLLYQQAGPRVVIEAQGGMWLPFDGSAGLPTSSTEKFSGRVFFWGVGPSVEAIQTSRIRVAPVVELVGWRVLSGFATGVGDTSAVSILNLKIGARVAWEPSGSIYVGYGHALSDATWYDDILRFEYRVGF